MATVSPGAKVARILSSAGNIGDVALKRFTEAGAIGRFRVAAGQCSFCHALRPHLSGDLLRFLLKGRKTNHRLADILLFAEEQTSRRDGFWSSSGIDESEQVLHSEIDLGLIAVRRFHFADTQTERAGRF